MKTKLLLLASAALLLSQIGLAQRNTAFRRLLTNHSLQNENSTRLAPAQVQSVGWHPGKMIESRWDTLSSSWNYNDSTVYSYNWSGDEIQNLQWSNNPNPDSRTITTYSATAKILQKLTQSWNGTSWMNSGKSDYTYNTSDSLTEVLNQNWNISLNAWDNAYDFLYTYNASNQLTERTMMSWNTTLSAWEGIFKNTYTYNASNQILTEVHQSWNTSLTNWENSSQYTNTYNSNNQLSQTIGQTWNTSSNVWENDYKDNLTYNGNGVLTNFVEQTWNVSSWENSYKVDNITFYQWTGDLETAVFLSDTEQVWLNNSWQLGSRYKCTYDVHANPTDYLGEDWQNNQWITNYHERNIFAYDANNNMLQDIFQRQSSAQSGLVNEWRRDFSNYNLYTGIAGNAAPDQTVLVYPNPGNGIITIESPALITSIQVVNMLGEVVYSENVNASKTEIDLSGKDKGIYFYRLEGKGGTVSNGKLLVQ